METSILRRNSIIEHCSCGLTFKVDKSPNSNIISTSTSLLALNTNYNENPGLIEQSLTQSQILTSESQQHPVNKFYNNHHQHHAHHCHHHQPSQSAPPLAVASIPPPSSSALTSTSSQRYQPTEPPVIHTHEYFSQESQEQSTINTTTTTATPHSHGCRHSHVHAQTDFSYGPR